MFRTRILASLTAAVLGMASMSACSTESLTERAVSFGLEQAIEGNEDINLDLGDNGSGGFSISTEEGDFAISFDEENGGITFDTDDGAGAITIDEDGIIFDTDEGNGVISFDDENGEIVFDTDAGDGVISFDEDNGTVKFEGDAGSAAIGATPIPDGWPAAIGVPRTVNVDTMLFRETNTEGGSSLGGVFEHAADDTFSGDAADALVAEGWVVAVDNETANGRQIQLRNGDALAMFATIDRTTTMVTLLNFQ